MKAQNLNLFLGDKLSTLPDNAQKELEAFVVNSVKVRMIKKLDTHLQSKGMLNARKLFLVPVFTISEMQKRVSEKAPEMTTFFYKELTQELERVEKTFA